MSKYKTTLKTPIPVTVPKFFVISSKREIKIENKHFKIYNTLTFLRHASPWSIESSHWIKCRPVQVSPNLFGKSHVAQAECMSLHRDHGSVLNGLEMKKKKKKSFVENLRSTGLHQFKGSTGARRWGSWFLIQHQLPWSCTALRHWHSCCPPTLLTTRGAPEPFLIRALNRLCVLLKSDWPLCVWTPVFVGQDLYTWVLWPSHTHHLSPFLS